MTSNIFHRIVCHTRYDDQKQDPKDLLSKIKTAIEHPLLVIKEITNPREVKRTLKINIAPWGDLCLHEYRWNLKRIAFSPFRLSRGERTWNFYDDIRRSKIIVPEPIILIEVKKLIFTTHTYVATRWFDRAFKLDQIALRKDSPYSFDLQSIFYQCTDTIADLHNAGFIHGDLKWSNFLYIHKRNPNIVLTDLDALKKSSSVSSQSKDFARFLIAPDNYSFEKETIKLLIERYIKIRDSSRSSVKKTIQRYLAKKNILYHRHL
jgi:tRNA A-37 threonylcarbamoyl transferase component Bud32